MVVQEIVAHEEGQLQLTAALSLAYSHAQSCNIHNYSRITSESCLQSYQELVQKILWIKCYKCSTFTTPPPSVEDCDSGCCLVDQKITHARAQHIRLCAILKLILACNVLTHKTCPIIMCCFIVEGYRYCSLVSKIGYWILWLLGDQLFQGSLQLVLDRLFWKFNIVNQ